MAEANKKHVNILDSESGTSDADRFRDLAMRYQEIGAQEGIRIIPFRSPDMPLFQKATPEKRKAAIDFLETIVGIHEEVLAAGEKPSDSRKLVWRALRKLSLIPSPDVFDCFGDEEVVVIYQADQKAVFWSIQFFKFASLTVEDLFFSVWHEFTKRDDEIQKHLYNMAVAFITGKITTTCNPSVPGHVVEEVNTLECIKTWMEIPWGSPLTKNGAFAGILVVQTMRII